MVNGPLLVGSPSTTAILAPGGSAAGAGPHLSACAVGEAPCAGNARAPASAVTTRAADTSGVRRRIRHLRDEGRRGRGRSRGISETSLRYVSWRRSAPAVAVAKRPVRAPPVYGGGRSLASVLARIHLPARGECAAPPGEESTSLES